MKKFKIRIKIFLNHFKKVISKPEMAILPGQLAYFFVLAIVPTITILTLGAASLNLSTDVIYTFLESSLSKDVADMILSVNIGTVSGTATIIVTIIAYYVSSQGATSIIITSNTIYGIPNDSYIKRKLKSFVMIFILLLLFILLISVTMYGDLFMDFIRNSNLSSDVITNVILIITVLQGPVMWLLLFLFIKLIYTMAPDRKIKSSDVNYGAVFTTVCWIGLTALYSIYVNDFANYDALYGNLANLAILMLWFYFLALIFTIGLALNYHNEEEENTKKLELKTDN